MKYLAILAMLMLLVACGPQPEVQDADDVMPEPQATTPPPPQEEPPEYSPVDDTALTGEKVDMGNEQDSY